MVNYRIKLFHFVSLLVIFSSIYHQSFAGGGWVSGQYHGYFKIGQSYIRASDYFTPKGQVIPITTIGIYTTSLYGQFGLTDRLDVIAYVPFFTRSTLNQLNDSNGNMLVQGDELNSIGDIDLTLKYGVIKNKPWVVAASLTLGLPSGNPTGGATSSLQTGDGEFNQMISIDMSRSLGKFYFSFLGGFNNRAKGFSNEFRYGTEVGYGTEKFYYILRFHGIKPLGKDQQELTTINGVFGNRVEYFSFSPEINYQAGKKWGITAGMGGVIYAKRILAAPNFMAGIYLKI